jgi:hypothetical protein
MFEKIQKYFKAIREHFQNLNIESSPVVQKLFHVKV